MTILRAQADSNKRGLCCCGQRATSELSYAEEMDQHQDASSPSVPPSLLPTDRLYRTPPVEGVSQLVPITGGKGVITQWVHGEFIVSFETIHPVNTHQVCVEYF